MKKNFDLSESLEDYLEIILDLEHTKKVARAKDIAEKMGVKRASVTSALKSLEEKKLINYEPYSFVTLTDKGKKIAEEVTYKHGVLKDFLIEILQIDEKTAESTACRMEHAIDKKTFESLLKFFNFIYRCPKAGKQWIHSFVNYCDSEVQNQEQCEKCIEDCKAEYAKFLAKKS